MPLQLWHGKPHANVFSVCGDVLQLVQQWLVTLQVWHGKPQASNMLVYVVTCGAAVTCAPAMGDVVAWQGTSQHMALLRVVNYTEAGCRLQQ